MYANNLGLRFTQTVNSFPNRLAISCPSYAVSFSKIDALASRMAHYLIEMGCCRGNVIAIGNTKKIESYALMIAAVKIGVAYVCIDVASPIDRNVRILSIAQPRLLFSDDRLHHQYIVDLARQTAIPPMSIQEVVSKLPDSYDSVVLSNVMNSVDGSTIAYIMFTSGSTGLPKGVAVTHQNVLHFIEWGRDKFEVGPDSNFANVSPMYFDNSVFDFYVGLFSGATLTPVSRELLNSPLELVDFVRSMKCTMWFSVPSLLMYLTTMKVFKTTSLPNLRQIVFGGEGYPKTELLKLFNEFKDQTSVYNVYGPTECTCICSAHQITSSDFESLEGLPMLGSLNPNFDFMILDDAGIEADEGELCLIGPNVAAGYFNDIERTSQSFVTLHASNRFMKRMYRTGDIVRLASGSIHFIGRKDNQIKHMGYRIELEEIENTLMRIKGIHQAAAVYSRVHATHGKIIAFVGCQDVTAVRDSIAEELSALLPGYMMPSRIYVMSQLPKNANGKVDRTGLAQVSANRNPPINDAYYIVSPNSGKQ